MRNLKSTNKQRTKTEGADINSFIPSSLKNHHRSTRNKTVARPNPET